jgi:predicted permease
MGIPVINALFRGSAGLSEMLIYVSVYIAVFNIVNWTVGIYIISGNKKYITVKNALINPTTVALVIALPLFFLGVSLDERFAELASAFRMLGDMTTPLSMIIIGIKLAEMPLKRYFPLLRVYILIYKAAYSPCWFFWR